MLKRLQSTVLSTTIVVLISQSGFAQKNGKQIYEENRTSILYLEVVRKDNPSQVTDRGTGFVISHDGYVLTAGHIQVGPNETLQAIVGQSAGLRYNLEFQQNLFDPINKAGTDLSLWRLPQAPGCDRAVLLTEQLPEPSDALWILSFSETRSLGPHVASVVSTQGPEGTILADTNLEHGESGAPVFNSAGAVVGIVSGGHLATNRNDIITPTRHASVLLTRAGQWPPRTESERYPALCFKECINPANGIIGWEATKPWNRDSPWLGGGNNQPAVCNGLARSDEIANPGWSIDITAMSESSKEEFYRQFFYMYHCSGIMRHGPIYRSARAAVCGIDEIRR